jgi:hypothetical protein
MNDDPPGNVGRAARIRAREARQPQSRAQAIRLDRFRCARDSQHRRALRPRGRAWIVCAAMHPGQLAALVIRPGYDRGMGG